jgi:hypothetical protein
VRFGKPGNRYRVREASFNEERLGKAGGSMASVEFIDQSGCRLACKACTLVAVQFVGRSARSPYAGWSSPMSVAANPSIERTSYRWLRQRQAAAHVER